MKTSKKKNTINTDGFVKNIRFCVECGKELDNYSLLDGETNENARERFNECCKSGKFKGDFCSRIFINEYDENTSIEEELKNIRFPEDEDT